jgi:3D-(3,5/4)-trihydroxycyclohexane-1,2-dione acylhydrolase (decyclizing)
MAGVKTVRMTMAQALVRFLDAQYIEVDGKEYKFVKGVFGIFGHGNVVGLGEALVEGRHGLTYYQGHNEQGMVHVAVGFAKQTKRRQIFAVTSSIGPGALNMVTGAATATVNRIPVLLLPGDVFACRQPDPVLQQVEQFGDPNVTANDAFKPVSRYWDRINRPEQLLSACLNAMRVLTDPAETGAVTLALPQDVQGEAWDYPEEFFRKRVHLIPRQVPAAEEVERSVNLIAQAKKPLVICGGGVRYSDGGKALKNFCEKSAIPFAETQAGKGVLPWDHPYNLGGIGVTGTLAANRIAKTADLVIGVGTRFGDFTTGSKRLFQNPKVHFLAINVNRFDAYKMEATQVVGDAREVLKLLTRALVRRGYRSGYTGEVATARDRWKAEVDRLYSSEDPDGLSQTRCLGELNERLLPRNAIVVASSGSLPGDMQRVWRPRIEDSYHMEYGFSCMGYEIAAALGVKMAAPQREVFALVGDGSYVMLHSELLTSLIEGIKINVLVFDNHGFQVIDNLQTSQGIQSYGNSWRFRDPESGGLTGQYVPLDFARNGESYGALGLRVGSLEELRNGVQKALRAERSTVIDIKVSEKSMTHGYESWWRVGTAEVSTSPKVVEAARKLREEAAGARRF